MKLIKLLAIVALIPGVALAQTLDDEISVELDKMYEQAAPSQGAGAAQGTAQGSQAAQVQVNVQAQPQAVATNNTEQAATQATSQTQLVRQAQVQKQPTTMIEASPLTESRAERLRKARQDAELTTEQTIVEKLEESRMEDERRRSEVLFGDKFGQMNSKPVAAAPVAVVPVQEVHVAPAPTGLGRDEVRGEISAALDEYKASQVKPENKAYVGALLGVGDYPDARNVEGQYAAGFAVGKKFDKLVVEGSFLYSNYRIEQIATLGGGGTICDPLVGCYPRITEMDQYNGSALVKYQLFNGVFRPVLGGLLSYTYRSFTDTQFSVTNDSATSQAVDMGLMTGVDLELSETFALGLDFRYLWNLTSKVNTGYQTSYIQPQLQATRPIEKLSYYTMGLVARYSF